MSTRIEPRESASLNVNMWNILAHAHGNADAYRETMPRLNRRRALLEDWLPTAIEAESAGVVGAVAVYERELRELTEWLAERGF
jgi:hypothetical protein